MQSAERQQQNMELTEKRTLQLAGSSHLSSLVLTSLDDTWRSTPKECNWRSMIEWYTGGPLRPIANDMGNSAGDVVWCLVKTKSYFATLSASSELLSVLHAVTTKSEKKWSQFIQPKIYATRHFARANTRPSTPISLHINISHNFFLLPFFCSVACRHLTEHFSTLLHLVTSGVESELIV